jgi:preprotein translocase subunit SecE
MMRISSPRGLLKDLVFNYYSSMQSFFTGLKTEFGKITWPDGSEAFGVAVLVIIIAIVTAYYLGLLDYIFSAILKLIIG